MANEALETDRPTPRRRGRPPRNPQPITNTVEYDAPITLEQTQALFADNTPEEVENVFSDIIVPIPPKQSTPTVWASVAMKINIGNYENQEISFGVSGIPTDATPEVFENLMQESTMTIKSVVDRLATEMHRRLVEDYGR